MSRAEESVESMLMVWGWESVAVKAVSVKRVRRRVGRRERIFPE